MFTGRGISSTERPASWPAWCVSLTVHAGLVALMYFLLRHHLAEGPEELAERNVGIVLKEVTDEGTLFEEEPDRDPLEEVNTLAQDNSALEDSPTIAKIPSFDMQQEQRRTLGGGSVDSGSLGNAIEMARGGGASQALDGNATVRVFGAEGTGSKFVYVFDRSISMEGLPLRAAKHQLISSLDSLGSVHQFQVVFFNHEPQAWDLTGGQSRIAFATDANKRSAKKFVRGISASGGTYRLIALQLGLGMGPDVLFFLTDADDPMLPVDVTRLIHLATNRGVAINTIEFGVGQSSSRKNFLTQLAEGTGGQYVYVNTRQLHHQAR